MDCLYSYSLYKVGARFENSYINLIAFSEENEEDYAYISKALKGRLPGDICGVTSYVRWCGAENASRPVILILINRDKQTEDKLRLIFETVPHELYHAMAAVEERSQIKSGTEILAKEFGKACGIFQRRLLSNIGYEVVPKAK